MGTAMIGSLYDDNAIFMLLSIFLISISEYFFDRPKEIECWRDQEISNNNHSMV